MTTAQEYFEQAARESCASTVDGWLYYCDAHATHGNADTEDEAQHYAEAHEAFFREEEDCAVYVVKGAKTAFTLVNENDGE